MGKDSLHSIKRRTLRNRYSLYIYDKKKAYVVLVEENGKLKENLDITTIDKFIMSHCDTEENGRLELIDYLNKTIDNKEGIVKELAFQQKINPTTHISKSATPLILYLTRDKNKNISKPAYLQPVYHDPILLAFADTYDSVRREYSMKLKDFSMKQEQMQEEYKQGKLGLQKYNLRIESMEEVLDNINDSIKDKPSWKAMTQKVLNNLTNGTYISYVLSNGDTHSGYLYNKDLLISNRLKDYIRNYVYGSKSSDKEEAKKDIEDELKRYKVLRGIQLCDKNYQRNINEKRIKPSEKIDELIEFEELWYKGYINAKDLKPKDESHVFEIPEHNYVVNHQTGKMVYFDHTDEYIEEQMNDLEEHEKVKRK